MDPNMDHMVANMVVVFCPCLLHLLPQLAATLGPAEFWSHFGEVCARRASDSCALVREDWVVLMAEICGLGGFGQAWAEETLLPIVTALSGEQSYLLRAVVPSFTAGFAQILTPGSLETKLVPAVLEMASDRVPNLRMIAARALAACTPLVDPGMARESIVPKLQEMLADADVDVKFEADAALESVQSFNEALTYDMIHAKDGPVGQRLAGPIAMLKYHTTRMNHLVADNAVQILGGRGVSSGGMGRIVETFSKVYKVPAVYGGSEEIMADLAVRQAIKNYPKTARL